MMAVPAMGQRVDVAGRRLFLDRAGSVSPELIHQMNEGKPALYTNLAASFTRGEHRVLDLAGRSFLHMEQPVPVIQAVRDLLEETRA